MRVLVGTPCYAGMMHINYTKSILAFAVAGIPFDTAFVGNESLITRARNTILSTFFYATGYSHLFFLDADVGIDAASLNSLLKSEKDVIGASVALKGHTPEGRPILNGTLEDGEDPTNQLLCRMKHLGTACLILSRKAVSALVEDAIKQDRIYKPGDYTGGNAGGPGRPDHYDVFQVGCIDGTYLSEDYWVCHRLRELGFDIYCDTSIHTSHAGMSFFTN